jgi:hypothetical protein
MDRIELPADRTLKADLRVRSVLLLKVLLPQRLDWTIWRQRWRRDAGERGTSVSLRLAEWTARAKPAIRLIVSPSDPPA